MIDDNSNNSESIPKQEELLSEIPLEVIIPGTPIDEPIEETIPIKPKAKGRPKESKDKAPRPKRKVVIEEEPIEITPELPRALPDSIPIPTESNNINKYALMLNYCTNRNKIELIIKLNYTNHGLDTKNIINKWIWS